MEMYSLRDEKACLFGPVMVFRNRGEAMRAVADATTSQDSMVCKHPGDFALYKLGMFDEFTGEGDIHSPELICRASDLIQQH